MTSGVMSEYYHFFLPKILAKKPFFLILFSLLESTDGSRFETSVFWLTCGLGFTESTEVPRMPSLTASSQVSTYCWTLSVTAASIAFKLASESIDCTGDSVVISVPASTGSGSDSHLEADIVLCNYSLQQNNKTTTIIIVMYCYYYYYFCGL